MIFSKNKGVRYPSGELVNKAFDRRIFDQLFYSRSIKRAERPLSFLWRECCVHAVSVACKKDLRGAEFFCKVHREHVRGANCRLHIVGEHDIATEKRNAAIFENRIYEISIGYMKHAFFDLRACTRLQRDDGDSGIDESFREFIIQLPHSYNDISGIAEGVGRKRAIRDLVAVRERMPKRTGTMQKNQPHIGPCPVRSPDLLRDLFDPFAAERRTPACLLRENTSAELEDVHTVHGRTVTISPLLCHLDIRCYIPFSMAIQVSPVDMEVRKALDVRTGDTVRVTQKIPEKGKFRLQVFEGLVLARKHGKEAGGTFTVRRVASGVGVEKIFPLYSPMIEKIEVVKRSRVRRAKLYYIREKVAREARRQLRRTRLMGGGTTAEEKLEAEAEAEVRENSEPVAAEVVAEAKSE